MGNYLLEVGTLTMLPSLIAAAAIWLLCLILGNES